MFPGKFDAILQKNPALGGQVSVFNSWSFILEGLLEVALSRLAPDQDQISVSHTELHVFIYINKLFAARDQLEFCKSPTWIAFALCVSLLLVRKHFVWSSAE